MTSVLQEPESEELKATREHVLEKMSELLATPGRSKEARKATVLQGGKRPDYVRIDEVPANPTKGKDFALATAYRQLLAQYFSMERIAPA